MSINAIEVLEERLAKRQRGEYHVVEWTKAFWFPEQYPPPAATPYEVTPATGVPVGD